MVTSVGRWYVPDPNKAEDPEKLHLRSLLHKFETYKAGRMQLKQFRTGEEPKEPAYCPRYLGVPAPHDAIST